MRRPPEANRTAAPKGRRWRQLPPWPRRKPLTIKVTYRGGAEMWVEVHARGDLGRYPGHTALIDVLRDVWRDS